MILLTEEQLIVSSVDNVVKLNFITTHDQYYMKIPEYQKLLKKKAKPVQREDVECKAFWDWAKWQYDIGPCTFRIEHRGKKDIKYAVKLKNMGVKAGLGDFFLMHANKKYHGLWCEFKYGKGRQSPAQKEFEKRCLIEGYLYKVVYSAEEAIEIVKEYFEIK
jgi:hypothetical protein